MSLTVVGIDPDMKNVGMAVLFEDRIDDVRSAKIKGAPRGQACIPFAADVVDWAFIDLQEKYPEVDVVVVEGQQLYRGKTQNPEDIKNLATMSGLLVGLAHMIWPEVRIIVPSPKDWKGQVPKRIHQARMFSKLGWAYEQTSHKNESERYCFPKVEAIKEPPHNVSTINKGDWKHVGDAIGLALWGAMQDKGMSSTRSQSG